MKKRFLCLLLIICMCTTSCTIEAICQHRDVDDDSLCDKCGESYTDGNDTAAVCQHRDDDGDSLCDKCGEPYEENGEEIPVCQHRDADDDSLCDKCDEPYEDGIDIPVCQHRDADDTSLCDKCGEPYEDGVDIPVCQHRDADDNSLCDKCGEPYTDGTEDSVCQHRDADDDSLCDKCDEPYTDGKDVCTYHFDANEDGKCEICNTCVIHVDDNGDGKCDNCSICISHVDYNGDGRCDNCYICVSHVDYNGDGKCDNCSICVSHVDNDEDGRCDNCYICVSHVDSDEDGECDNCGADCTVDEVIEYPWESQTLIFQMTHNTNNDELPSGCERYLAGEDATATEDIDDMVANRNADAEYITGITVTYQYYPNTANYVWGKNIDRIESTVKSAASKDVPDMYCNFLYDMVGASLKSCFANLRSTSRGSGAYKGLNYFSFLDEDYDESVDNEGYMYEYMTSLTLSKHKMYILASDYFIDMVRAFFVIPVSVKLIEDTGAEITGNPDYSIEDFYQIVTDGSWTYQTLAQFAAAAHVDDGNSDTCDQWLGDEVVGFAMAGSPSGGTSASGLLYTTSVSIINREWNDSKNDWTYSYPSADNTELDDFCDATSWLFMQPGIVLVESSNTPNMTEWGQNPILAIRTRFTQNHVLFGDIILVGALEFAEYQYMKNSGGFGVVPVPLYRTGSNDRYLTQIHNVGRPGAIAANTLKFAECTAFLNYQSTHSTEILNEYYDYKLTYGVMGDTSEGTVEMLKYIRLNVRTSFDKVFEDAIGVFYGEEANRMKWHTIISAEDFIIDIRTKYDNIVDSKDEELKRLESYYEELPD